MIISKVCSCHLKNLICIFILHFLQRGRHSFITMKKFYNLLYHYWEFLAYNLYLTKETYDLWMLWIRIRIDYMFFAIPLCTTSLVIIKRIEISTFIKFRKKVILHLWETLLAYLRNLTVYQVLWQSDRNFNL